MPHLTRATLVRDAVERAALHARPDAPIPHQRVHGPSALTRLARARLALRTAVREWSERRHERATYGALKGQLATYSTRAEVDDLLGTIEERDDADADADAEMLRNILAKNLSSSHYDSATGS